MNETLSDETPGDVSFHSRNFSQSLVSVPVQKRSSTPLVCTVRISFSASSEQFSYLNRNPKAQLTPFLKERHVNHRTMMNWMCEKGYSVLRAKKEIRQAQEAARREKAEASASSTGMMFVPMEPPTIDLPMEDLLYGINITFPNGTLVSVKPNCWQRRAMIW